ncbi:MAG: Crp/Fnr family transcriptional regulator [Dehalococcoidia bacterium]|nr:Crp/Fnr family transcriptional regulator [Dehalococcoidia bacterium]
MDKIDFLGTTPLLAGVDRAAITEISQHVFEKRLRRGERIRNETGEAQAMYFVVEGVVKACKTSADGKEQIFSLMRPGDYFNEVLLDSGPILASAEALGTTLLYGIKKAHLRTIMRQHSQVAGNMIGMLSGRVRQLTALVEDLSFRSVAARVAKLLLENDRVTDKARLTQRDMAAIAGTVREVVSRTLGALEDRGFIEMYKRQIAIINPDGLKELSDPTA